MTVELTPGAVVDLLGLELELARVPAGQTLSGRPATGSVRLDERAGRELGVWEMTEGVAADVEVDEVFLVLAGSATVEGVQADAIELKAGSLVRLTAGMRTVWTVHETLRKLYLL